MFRSSVRSRPRLGRFPWRLCAILSLCSALALGQGASPVAGTWAGTLSSHNFASFPVSINVVQDSQGHLRGRATMAHQCVKQSTLIVTVVGSNVVLSGSDADGDTVTFRGNLDSAGKVLNLSFILNGSPSGRCETDDGKGTLNRQ